MIASAKGAKSVFCSFCDVRGGTLSNGLLHRSSRRHSYPSPLREDSLGEFQYNTRWMPAGMKVALHCTRAAVTGIKYHLSA